MADDLEREKLWDATAAKLDGQMCFTIDWCDEDLPLETRAGNDMDQLVQKMIDQTHNPPAFLEFFQKPKKEPAPQLEPAPPPTRERILVFPDQHGFCSAILDNAPEGRVCEKQIVTEPYCSISQEDIERMIASGWDLIIFGCGLDMPASNGVHDIHAHQTNVTRLLFYIFKAMVRNENIVKKVSILSRGCFENDSELHETVGPGIATSGTLFGMANSARLEVPGAFQYIETEFCLEAPAWLWSETKYVRRLASEVFRDATFGHNTVRLLHRGRYILRQVMSTDYEAANCEFGMPQEGSVILVTGGNGALGVIMGQWLLNKASEKKATGFTIKFLSRSAKVNEQNMPAWILVQKHAATLNVVVEQTRCDFGDESECNRIVEESTPNLFGIIHAAGVLQDAILGNQTWEKFETVWNAKNRAALHLHFALEKYSNPSFGFFWMFSSTSVYGNVGQINYAASNSYLDSLCRHRRATGKCALSIQWGAWGEVGMAANLDAASKRRFAASSQPPFLTKDGLRGLDAGLKTGLPGVAVFKINPDALFELITPCDTPTACYMRNLCSLLVPTTGAPTLERVHLYTMFRLLRDGYYGGSVERLLRDKFVLPLIEKNAEDTKY
eukprot:TRINITY_DN1564_c1_g1_i3.p1 TRINITY_DN1564_c1_g1~~TRINITY_DN1564_c1_g1_i3.p1  ORF type:complete len:613 (+),score=80.50 TRINITY_DN1564_c1_g1_i3:50-1888(+)